MQGPRGQAIVAQTGFVAQTVQAVKGEGSVVAGQVNVDGLRLDARIAPVLPEGGETRIVSAGGAMAKSRRLGVRWKAPSGPVKGRAMTRPTRSAWTCGARSSQRRIRRSRPKASSCAAICSTLSTEL